MFGAMPVTIIACYENHVGILVWTPMSSDVEQWGIGQISFNGPNLDPPIPGHEF
jgi:hypothetical protein